MFECEFCGVALTHDSRSVRKSHAQGRNHIRYFIEYYELVAKELNLLPEELPLTSSSRAATYPFPLKWNQLDQSIELSQLHNQAPGVLLSGDRIEGVLVKNRLESIPFPAHIPDLPFNQSEPDYQKLANTAAMSYAQYASKQP